MAARLLDGITLGGDATGNEKLKAIVIIALIFGLINAIVRPIVKVLAFPAILLTLGLFLIVVNALMLELLSWLSGKWGLAFHVDKFFWTAILGSIIISIVSILANIVLPKNAEVH